MEVVYEDAQLLVVYKEAGLPVQTNRLAQEDLESRVKNYISQTAGKKNPYLGIINRLDQPVEGLVLFGKTKTATAALNKSLQSGKIEKWYYALVYGKRKAKQEKLEQYLVFDHRKNQTSVGSKDTPGAKYASLKYCVMEEGEDCQLLNIQLQTGRHHQIRVQFSATGTPLLGDSRYGTEQSKNLSKALGIKNPALCAYKLVFPDPVTGEERKFSIAPQNAVMGAYIHET